MNELDHKKADTSSVISAGTEIPDNEDIEVDDSFFDDEIDVVSAEYIPDMNQPTISFNKCRLNVNMACINRFPETDYVQFLLNKTKNQLALLPCQEDERDAIRWLTINRKSGKRQPRYATAHILSAMLFEYMGWDIQRRYSLVGKIKISRGVKLLVFDLGSQNKDCKSKLSQEHFSNDWNGHFGTPFKEHERIMEVTTFKSYATISITDNNSTIPEDTTGEKVTDYKDEITNPEN